MQSNVFAYILSLIAPNKIRFWAKIAVFAGLLAYIGHVLWQQPFDWVVVQRQWRTVDDPACWAMALLLLTPINWGFEALKWQLLIRRVEAVSLADAYQGVLAGLTLGFALPAQLGDTTGRVLSLRSAGRGAAVGASLVSGGMQFYVALVAGGLAWWQYLRVVPARQTATSAWLLGLVLALSALGIVFGLVRRPLLQGLANRPRLRRWSGYWTIAVAYSNAELAKALVAATLRYVVFAGQFYLALRLTGIVLPVDLAVSGIGLVFLVKTITPAFNLLSDLGVREAAALWVFAPAGLPAPVLLTATLTLWLVNVLLPVLTGLLWVWRLKLTTA
ncbi:hypothetical protein GCM10027578_21200 [Spirosoma luteolum]